MLSISLNTTIELGCLTSGERRATHNNQYLSLKVYAPLNSQAALLAGVGTSLSQDISEREPMSTSPQRSTATTNITNCNPSRLAIIQQVQQYCKCRIEMDRVLFTFYSSSSEGGADDAERLMGDDNTISKSFAAQQSPPQTARWSSFYPSPSPKRKDTDGANNGQNNNDLHTHHGTPSSQLKEIIVRLAFVDYIDTVGDRVTLTMAGCDSRIITLSFNDDVASASSVGGILKSRHDHVMKQAANDRKGQTEISNATNNTLHSTVLSSAQQKWHYVDTTNSSSTNLPQRNLKEAANAFANIASSLSASRGGGGGVGKDKLLLEQNGSKNIKGEFFSDDVTIPFRRDLTVSGNAASVGGIDPTQTSQSTKNIFTKEIAFYPTLRSADQFHQSPSHPYKVMAAHRSEEQRRQQAQEAELRAAREREAETNEKMKLLETKVEDMKHELEVLRTLQAATQPVTVMTRSRGLSMMKGGSVTAAHNNNNAVASALERFTENQLKLIDFDVILQPTIDYTAINRNSSANNVSSEAKNYASEILLLSAKELQAAAIAGASPKVKQQLATRAALRIGMQGNPVEGTNNNLTISTNVGHSVSSPLQTLFVSPITTTREAGNATTTSSTSATPSVSFRHYRRPSAVAHLAASPSGGEASNTSVGLTSHVSHDSARVTKTLSSQRRERAILSQSAAVSQSNNMSTSPAVTRVSSVSRGNKEQETPTSITKTTATVSDNSKPQLQSKSDLMAQSPQSPAPLSTNTVAASPVNEGSTGGSGSAAPVVGGAPPTAPPPPPPPKKAPPPPPKKSAQPPPTQGETSPSLPQSITLTSPPLPQAPEPPKTVPQVEAAYDPSSGLPPPPPRKAPPPAKKAVPKPPGEW